MKNLCLAILFASIIQTTLRAQDKPCTETCNNNIKHSYLSCIEDIINVGTVFTDLGREFFGGDVKVSFKDEFNAGEELLRESKKKYTFINSGEKFQNLNSMLAKLVSKIQNRQSYTFNVYLIETDEINAWTCGGKIFFTTGIYNFCENNDEIASILGHEISHNLLGHINSRLKDLKIANQFGIPGMLAAAVGMAATQSIGQKNEAHSDLLGVDLVSAAGYKICEAISLWKRMSEKSGDFNVLSNFLSSHPHPEKRAICIANHIKTKYQLKCGN
jgi:predicted Zn-dependent protease